ncbi:MAG: hypothetical protein RL300_74 [Pseudomonadota bacterium]|jgi:hypothetical protein
MQKTSIQALFTIAGLALTLGVQAQQSIYRCGSVYSQIPCPGGEPMNLNDPRQPDQKKQTDAAVERDAKTAATMEQTRLSEEKRLLAAQHPIKAAPPEKHEAGTTGTNATTTLTPKKPQAQHKKPEGFIAEVPGTGKPVKQKKAKKRSA